MNRALSASDLPLVMWLCGRLDPSNTPTALPQHILVCLLQQLSASNLLDDTVRPVHHLQMPSGRVGSYIGVDGVIVSDGKVSIFWYIVFKRTKSNIKLKAIFRK